MPDKLPSIYAPRLSHSEPGDIAAYDVVELQKKLIGELRVLNYLEHPDVDDQMARFIEESWWGNEHSSVEGDLSDGRMVFTKGINENAHFIIEVGDDEQLESGEWVQKLNNLFIFDKRSRRICNFRDLWMGNPLYQGGIQPLVITSAEVARLRSMAHLIKTRRPVIAFPYLFARSGRAYFDIPQGARTIAIPHEIGHLLQMNEKTRRLCAKSLVDASDGGSSMVWLRLLSHFPFIGKEIIEARNELVKMERNANAFAMGVYRKLRDGGIDVTDVLPKMVDDAEMVLRAEDTSWWGVKGNRFRSRGK